MATIPPSKASPLKPAQFPLPKRKMITEAANRLSEANAKKLLGVDHWVHDVSWQEALELLVSRPTVNIEGLVGGYTGPGGKTILPGRAVAKIDMRLVPDMTAAEALAAFKGAPRQERFRRYRSENERRLTIPPARPPTPR